MLVPESLCAAYEQGIQAPPGAIQRPSGVDGARQRRLLYALERASQPTQTPPLTVQILTMRQRRDIGTATRYDLTIVARGRQCDLHHLRASDILDYGRLRPIALDSARLVLPTLSRGQGRLWAEATQAALDLAEVVDLEPGESEALEIREVLSDVIEAARPWEWAEDDPYPRGIARIAREAEVGWPRGPVLRQVRASLGRVSRVALACACGSLALRAREWRIETAHLRVWARQAEVTP